jgi:hypothetical protein
MNRRRPNNVRFRWSSQPNTSSLPSPQSAEIIGSLFSSKSRKAGHVPSRGTVTVRSPSSVGHRHPVDRVRHGRPRTMHRERMCMPLPQMIDAKEGRSDG